MSSQKQREMGAKNRMLRDAYNTMMGGANE